METGTSEEEAKTDLCRAVADRKIHVRASIRSDVFSNGNVSVPPHLRPEDLDWTQSRPFGPWWIGPKLGQHYVWDRQKRSLDLIELSTSDVITILAVRAPWWRPCGRRPLRSWHLRRILRAILKRREPKRPIGAANTATIWVSEHLTEFGRKRARGRA